MPIFKGINSFKDSEHARKASVFLPLCNRHNVASVLFTRRSENVGTHKGHVSFPGGHIDPDETVIDAALREVYEELGLKIGNMQVLGIGQRVPAVTGTLVTPVIGFLENDVLDFDHFHPSDHEIDEVFTVPLHTLLDPSYRKTEMLTRRLPNDKIDTNIYPSSSNINSYNADTPMEFPYFGDVQSPQRIWYALTLSTHHVIDHFYSFDA